MVRLIFGRDFASENERFLLLKMRNFVLESAAQRECASYKVEKLNVFANTVCDITLHVCFQLRKKHDLMVKL